MLKFIKSEIYYRLAMYNYKKTKKHLDKYAKHRDLAKLYENKHRNLWN